MLAVGDTAIQAVLLRGVQERLSERGGFLSVQEILRKNRWRGNSGEGRLGFGEFENATDRLVSPRCSTDPTGSHLF